MKTKNIKQWTILPCTPDKAYNAWLDSKKHGEMIEGNAKIDPKTGGLFNIWDSSVTGKTLELDPKKLMIVQEWRYEYDNWPKDHFSKVTVEFLHHGTNETKLNFSQIDIPAEYSKDIEKGWKEYYWEPMKKYFTKR